MLDTRHTDATLTAQGAERQTSLARAISDQLVKLYATYLGRGPTRSRATLTAELVIVTFSETMTRVEQHFVAAGEVEAVQSMRRTFHRATRQQAIDIVERTAQRTVASYMADIDAQANIALLAFVLDPVSEAQASAHPEARRSP